MISNVNQFYWAYQLKITNWNLKREKERKREKKNKIKLLLTFSISKIFQLSTFHIGTTKPLSISEKKIGYKEKKLSVSKICIDSKFHSSIGKHKMIRLKPWTNDCTKKYTDRKYFFSIENNVNDNDRMNGMKRVKEKKKNSYMFGSQNCYTRWKVEAIQRERDEMEYHFALRYRFYWQSHWNKSNQCTIVRTIVYCMKMNERNRFVLVTVKYYWHIVKTLDRLYVQIIWFNRYLSFFYISFSFSFDLAILHFIFFRFISFRILFFWFFVYRFLFCHSWDWFDLESFGLSVRFAFYLHQTALASIALLFVE